MHISTMLPCISHVINTFVAMLSMHVFSVHIIVSDCWHYQFCQFLTHISASCGCQFLWLIANAYCHKVIIAIVAILSLPAGCTVALCCTIIHVVQLLLPLWMPQYFMLWPAIQLLHGVQCFMKIYMFCGHKYVQCWLSGCHNDIS